MRSEVSTVEPKKLASKPQLGAEETFAGLGHPFGLIRSFSVKIYSHRYLSNPVYSFLFILLIMFIMPTLPVFANNTSFVSRRINTKITLTFHFVWSTGTWHSDMGIDIRTLIFTQKNVKFSEYCRVPTFEHVFMAERLHKHICNLLWSLIWLSLHTINVHKICTKIVKAKQKQCSRIPSN